MVASARQAAREGSLLKQTVRRGCHDASMLDLTSAVTSVVTGHSTRLVRAAWALAASASAWLLLLSLLTGRAPLELIDQATRWLGLSWSTARAAAWMAPRAEVMEVAALLLAVCAVVGVAGGAARWFSSTQGPTVLSVMCVLARQLDAGVDWLVVLLLFWVGIAWLAPANHRQVLMATIMPAGLMLMFPALWMITVLSTERPSGESRRPQVAPTRNRA